MTLTEFIRWALTRWTDTVPPESPPPEPIDQALQVFGDVERCGNCRYFANGECLFHREPVDPADYCGSWEARR